MSADRSRCRPPRVAMACAVAAVFAHFTAACGAASRVGPAEVSDVDGAPCFSIPDERETRNSVVRLYSLHISEVKAADWKTLPAQLWAFSIEPPGEFIAVKPGSCIRYGDAPGPASVQQQAQRLQPYRLYSVDINARPADSASPTRGYKAEFCVKPGGAGKPVVQTVPWDKTASRWRYEVCAKP